MKKDDVEQFLAEFKTKLKIFHIYFLDDRKKNIQGLADLDITATKRIDYIKNLNVDNYCSGPNKDSLGLNLGDYWEFGIKVKRTEVYIKVRLGKPNSKVICISFHKAERKMKYPFKKGDD